MARNRHSYRRSNVILIRFTILLLAGYVLRAEPAAEVPDIGATWSVEWSAKHLDQVLALYAPDAIFFSTDGGHFAGLPAIRDFFKKTLATNDPTIHMHRMANQQAGTLAYQSGEYKETIVTAGQKRDYQGDYLLVLRNQNGHWLIVEQMFTGSPVPAH